MGGEADDLDDDRIMERYGLVKRHQAAPEDDSRYFSQDENRDGERANSESEHYTKKVKRNNFLRLWQNEYSADKFVATHLYGAIDNMSMEMGEEEINDLLNSSAQNLSQTITKQVRRYDRQRGKVNKLTPFETYIALLKGYCVLSVLLCPKAFVNGGYGVSAIFLAASGVISLIACNKLVDAGLHTGIYSYPLVVEKVLGKRARTAVEVAVVLTQFSFVISHITFLVESCRSTIDTLFDVDSPLAVYIVAVCVVFTLFSWVRNLAAFSFTFIVGNFLIVATAIYVSVYAGTQLDGDAPNVQFANPPGVVNTLGFSIYCYEGIGVVMPIMATSAEPARFKEMLTFAMATLILVFVGFSELCYFTWGSDLTEPYVTQMLPKESVGVIVIKFLFSLNLLCSYPIVIYPANQSLEAWFCCCFRKGGRSAYWAANLSRLLVTLSATLLGIFLASKMDKFLGLIGSLACAPLALTFPCLVHLKLLATTRREKAADALMVLLSIFILFFCTITTISDWNEETTAH